MKKLFSRLIIFTAIIGIMSTIYYFSGQNKPVTVIKEKVPEVTQQPKANQQPEVKKDTEIQIIETPENEEKITVIDEPIIIEETIEIEDIIKNIKEDYSNISNEKSSWSFRRNNEHEPVLGYADLEMLKKYNAYYLGNTDEKVIYLTFDNGYENGYTQSILDTLKANDVKAAFFVTLPYIKNNKELVIRMKEEGHLVANHSKTHPSMPELDAEDIINEIKETEEYMYNETGYAMDKYFRPPMGEYSERSLSITNDLGYKTIFWSMAYGDWDVNNQPGALYAFDHVMSNHHPGAIPLLHAVSSSNAEALGDIIKALKEEGYRFATLDELK